MDVNNAANILSVRSIRNNRRLQNQINALRRENNDLENKYDTLENQYDELSQEVKKLVNEQDFEWRSYDGSGNNISNPQWGAAGFAFLRKSPSDYEDGKSTLAVRGSSNPNPRVVSNSICNVSGTPEKNEFNLTDMIWAWGQFLDHEIDLTPDNSDEKAYIETDAKDPNEDYPGRTIFFNRSRSIVNSEPREHPNVLSSYVDATNVYGSGSDRAFALRRLDGSGKMKTSLSDNKEVLLPLNTEGLSNASLPGQIPSNMFVAGDIRVNENIVLTSMHSLFVREHNRLCDVLVQTNPGLIGQEELIFQCARKIVSGIEQKITYDEFLPALLGSNSLNSYNTYDKNIDAGVKTEFSTAGFRLGHSMLSSNIKVGTNPNDDLLLRDAFFTPDYIKTNGIEQLLLGASKQKMKKINHLIIDDIRNFLFGPPTALHLLDLVTLNLQRGRDHGIPGYNAVREAYGLLKKTSFAEITDDITIQTKLEDLYDSPDNIDPWVGALCEDHVSGSPVGELTGAMLKEQFRKLRDGDRFWYQHDKSLGSFELNIINDSTLSKVISRNTNIGNELSSDVFRM